MNSPLNFLFLVYVLSEVIFADGTVYNVVKKMHGTLNALNLMQLILLKWVCMPSKSIRKFLFFLKRPGRRN